mgnify:CR=1 FL=1
MKIKITFTPEENATAAATLDALRRMHPTARAHENINNTGVSAAFLTVTNPKKPHHTKENR